MTPDVRGCEHTPAEIPRNSCARKQHWALFLLTTVARVYSGVSSGRRVGKGWTGGGGGVSIGSMGAPDLERLHAAADVGMLAAFWAAEDPDRPAVISDAGNR